MRRLLLILGLFSTSLGAQTVYYNHPKGVTFGFGVETTVAKLTLPAGTYHVIFKTSFGVPGQTVDAEPKDILCRLLVTGIPNTPSPFAADNFEIPISAPSGESLGSALGVMET